MINKKKNLEIKKSLNHVNQGSKTKNNSIPGGIKEKISFPICNFQLYEQQTSRMSGRKK